MDYSQLSDFEINAMVFEALYGGSPDCKEGDDSAMLLVSFEADVVGGDIVEVEVVSGSFNPCHNPADAWPIIESNHIALHPLKYKGIWVALSHDHEYSNRDVNPLRAAMVTFLTWKGSFNA